MPAVILVAVACGGGRKTSAKADEPAIRSISAPRAPGLLEDKLEWQLVHYWDAFADTASVRYLTDAEHICGVSLSDFEGMMAGFCYLLMQTPDRAAAIAGANAYAQKTIGRKACLDMAEKYLYDPNSPYRDEDLYAVVLKRFQPDSPLLAKCALNRVGTKAEDFEYYDSHGRTQTLYKTPGHHIIILFGNPECNACKDIKTRMEGSALLQELLAKGTVALVVIPLEEDFSEWDDIYHIRAIPSLYLLDQDKTVIYKDCPVEWLFNYLKNEYRQTGF